LSSIGLPAIVQLIGELHHTGSLDLTTGDQRAVLGFHEGRLVTADFAEKHGFEALEGLSAELADAEFSLSDTRPAAERTLDMGPSELQAYLRQAESPTSRLVNGEQLAVSDGARDEGHH